MQRFNRLSVVYLGRNLQHPSAVVLHQSFSSLVFFLLIYEQRVAVKQAFHMKYTVYVLKEHSSRLVFFSCTPSLVAGKLNFNVSCYVLFLFSQDYYSFCTNGKSCTSGLFYQSNIKTSTDLCT